jgi:hypothetical protein
VIELPAAEEPCCHADEFERQGLEGTVFGEDVVGGNGGRRPRLLGGALVAFGDSAQQANEPTAESDEMARRLEGGGAVVEADAGMLTHRTRIDAPGQNRVSRGALTFPMICDRAASITGRYQ